MDRRPDFPPAPTEATGGWRSLYRVAAVAAGLQFLAMFAYLYTGDMLPTAAEVFAAMQSQPLGGLRYGDFTTLVMVAMYDPVALCIWRVVRRRDHAWATVGLGMVLVAVTLTCASHPGHSLIHLSEQHAAATSDAEREALRIAGDAVLATGIWNATSGFVGGIGLQGGAVVLSLLMLRCRGFSRATAWFGLAANGLDLAQHLLGGVGLHPPGWLMMFAGLAYVPWFPLLSYDLWVAGRRAAERENAVPLEPHVASAGDQAPPAPRPAAPGPPPAPVAEAGGGAPGR